MFQSDIVEASGPLCLHPISIRYVEKIVADRHSFDSAPPPPSPPHVMKVVGSLGNGIILISNILISIQRFSP